MDGKLVTDEIIKPSHSPEPRRGLKPVSEVTACVVDYGTFISVAERLAEDMKQVYYYSPFEEEYQDAREYLKATGLEKVKKLDNIFDPDIFNSIDLFVFPDIGYGGLQKYLRSVGKAVWGTMGATDLELHRDQFLEVVESVGLPVIPYKRIEGVTKLREYLKGKKDKWIKINRFRRNMETWHWIDWDNSSHILDGFTITFGGVKDQIVFVVQDNLESDMECGYDGWCVDGKYPSQSFQGYEKKNELYLGSLLPTSKTAKEINEVNGKMAPELFRYGYRCWWATEIRVKDKKPYFTDPTARMPGQTGEHQTETLENFSEVVWQGANGNLVEPKYKVPFAAEATLHYTACSSDDAIEKEWKALRFPKESLKWLKLYHYCVVDGVHHFAPQGHDEVGVVIGVGKSVEECLRNLKDNFDKIKHLPLEIEMEGFADLLKSIDEAQEEGMFFADEVPDPAWIAELLHGGGGKKEKHGFDFDGVVSEGVLPKTGDVVVTGRKNDKEGEEVEKSMKEQGAPPVKVEKYPKSDLSGDKEVRDGQIAEHKVKNIKKHGITKFYEDTPAQAEIIRKKTHIPVVEVKGEK